MNNQLLIACGCSFTHGIGYTPYPEIFSKLIGYDFKNLAKAGASNYCISKQVEESLKYNPSLVIIGTTTPMRFDFLSQNNSIRKQPTLSDFNYDSESLSDAKIESRSILWFHKMMESDESDSETKIRYKSIIDFYLREVNYYLKKDQDFFCILGACCLLEHRNIPYLIVDFDSILSKESNSNVVSTHWYELSKKYPHEVHPNHFNDQGHELIAKQIFDFKNDKISK